MKFTIESGLALLKAADLVHELKHWEIEDDDGNVIEDIGPVLAVFFSDVWGWATSDVTLLPREEIPRLAELYDFYGWCGVLYWAFSKREWTRSAFYDNNRFIEFVAHEEAIKQEVPGYTERGSAKRVYTIGEGFPNSGAVAQLEERHRPKVQVEGSTPSGASTPTARERQS